MEWIYYKLYRILKQDFLVKTVILTIFSWLSYFIMKTFIIEIYGRDFYIAIRENSLFMLISIIPVVLGFIILKIYFDDKRVIKIKDKYDLH